MRKILALFMAVVILSSAFSFAKGIETISEKISLQKPRIIEKEDFLKIDVEGSEYFINPGKPLIPKIIKVFEIPFGARNIEIDVTASEIKEINLEKELFSSLYPLKLSENEIEFNFELHQNYEIYPSSWYSYRIGCGLNDKMEHVTFVTVHLFPVRYKPEENKIY
ncbi:MAG: hypothetical protein H5T45_07685, partial [Thermoplasmatales archaeon]|nr:hypothetical protein [Thermoplasmatales archaeon]